MKRLLLVFLGLTAISLAAYSQSGQDFTSFGDEFLGQKNIVEIYPNPSVDFLTVRIDNSDLQSTVLVIHNIIGNKFEITAENTGTDEYRIDVRDLPAGYYLLSVKDANTQFSKTFKFLKR